MVSFSAAFEKNINKLLGGLSLRARNVVKKRYGLGGENNYTLEAIGRKEDITRERVRQIEADALAKLRGSDEFGALAGHEEALVSILNSYGGVIAKDAIFTLPELSTVKDLNSLLFFIDLSSAIAHRKEGGVLKARLYTKSAPIDGVEKAVVTFSNELKGSKEAIDGKEVLSRFSRHLKNNGVDGASERKLNTYISLAKNVEKNTWGQYGHVESPLIRPRGMREGAYVALVRSGSPLHFRDIASKIGEFWHKSVHVQTVHNELIKDDRFVLVGRGLYALREWGYEPGFVKQILVRVLKENGAMKKDEIIKEMLKRRQVKPSTVIINLQNKKLFRASNDGTYTLIS